MPGAHETWKEGSVGEDNPRGLGQPKPQGFLSVGVKFFERPWPPPSPSFFRGEKAHNFHTTFCPGQCSVGSVERTTHIGVSMEGALREIPERE